jgi:hypothetical protein
LALAVVAPAIAVSITIAVPVVIVFIASTGAFPIAVIVEPAFITRPDPDCAAVRRLSPIAAVPNVAAAYRIPVTVNPDVAGARSDRPYAVHTRWRRSAQFNTDGHLSFQDWCST